MRARWLFHLEVFIELTLKLVLNIFLCGSELSVLD